MVTGFEGGTLGHTDGFVRAARSPCSRSIQLPHCTSPCCCTWTVAEGVGCSQLAARARDPFWHEVLYGTLVELGAVRQLLELDGVAPQLESYLRSQGGLVGGPPGAPVGPLSASQVRTAAVHRFSPKSGPILLMGLRTFENLL